MERLDFRLFKIVFFVLVVILSTSHLSFGQYDPLTLLGTTSVNGDETVEFSFQYETETADIQARAESFIEDYDSIAVTSSEFLDIDNEKILKVNAFVVNRTTNHRLKWITVLDYVEKEKESGEVLASNDREIDVTTLNEAALVNRESEKVPAEEAVVVKETPVTSNETPEKSTPSTTDPVERPPVVLEETEIVEQVTDEPSDNEFVPEEPETYTHTKSSGETVVYKEETKLISGKFIQFGAFSVFNNATNEINRLVGYRIQMIKANEQYKLIAPFTKSDFKRAKVDYPDKKVWPVVYQKKELVILEEQ